MNIVLFGPPGSGKGTQAELLEEKLGLKHVNAGRLLRKEISQGTEIGKEIKEIVERGDLIDEELAAGVVEKEVKATVGKTKGFIFDGFPRSIVQAGLLEEMLSRLGEKVTIVIDLEVGEKLIIERLSSRRNCAGCGESYNVKTKPPKKEGVCDECGGKLYIRKDDQPEAIRERLNVYAERTKPLQDHYRKKGLLVKINGGQDIKKVAEDVMREVNKLTTST